MLENLYHYFLFFSISPDLWDPSSEYAIFSLWTFLSYISFYFLEKNWEKHGTTVLGLWLGQKARKVSRVLLKTREVNPLSSLMKITSKVNDAQQNNPSSL